MLPQHSLVLNEETISYHSPPPLLAFDPFCYSEDWSSLPLSSNPFNFQVTERKNLPKLTYHNKFLIDFLSMKVGTISSCIKGLLADERFSLSERI